MLFPAPGVLSRRHSGARRHYLYRRCSHSAGLRCFRTLCHSLYDAGRFCRARNLWLVSLGCVGLTALAQVLAHRLVLSSHELAYIGSFNAIVSVVAIALSAYLILRGQSAEAALLRAQADLMHVSRMTTMGELTASIAHEVNQPIAGVVANGAACLRWLSGDAPDLNEARAAATRIVRDGTRASEIISRIRQIFVKGSPQRQLTNLNLLARETIDLLSNEASRYAISIRTDLATDIPRVLADPVQLQQVMVNLIANGIDSMKEVAGVRELVLRLWQPEGDLIAMSVSDSGKGLPSGETEQVFKAFFTTKPHGTGMDWRSAAPSSKPITVRCRQGRTTRTVRRFSSLCRFRAPNRLDRATGSAQSNLPVSHCPATPWCDTKV